MSYNRDAYREGVGYVISHKDSCCHKVSRSGAIWYNYPETCPTHTVTADLVTEGSGEWAFVTERGVKVEIGRSTHRPGFGITYNTRPGFYN